MCKLFINKEIEDNQDYETLLDKESESKTN